MANVGCKWIIQTLNFIECKISFNLWTLKIRTLTFNIKKSMLCVFLSAVVNVYYTIILATHPGFFQGGSLNNMKTWFIQ